jgi:serum/glucocorticoid-regulated kinase 2
VLIQGTGAVRAGVWARSVCINESIERGSMLPLIKIAQANGMSVIVFNPNLSRKDGRIIPYSHSMEEHSKFVWYRYVEPSHFEEIYIVAHSAGGGCLSTI